MKDTRIACPRCGTRTWMTDYAAFMRDHDRSDGRRCLNIGDTVKIAPWADAFGMEYATVEKIGRKWITVAWTLNSKVKSRFPVVGTDALTKVI